VAKRKTVIVFLTSNFDLSAGSFAVPWASVVYSIFIEIPNSCPFRGLLVKSVETTSRCVMMSKITLIFFHKIENDWFVMLLTVINIFVLIIAPMKIAK